jgi:hypothetical protein
MNGVRVYGLFCYITVHWVKFSEIGQSESQVSVVHKLGHNKVITAILMARATAMLRLVMGMRVFDLYTVSACRWRRQKGKPAPGEYAWAILFLGIWTQEPGPSGARLLTRSQFASGRSCDRPTRSRFSLVLPWSHSKC